MSAMDSWGRGAVIYEIYPRSFLDTNDDGVGDLPGIIERLDYVASLGVDALWIAPFFKSPMHDFGYDVADHCSVDPLFGTLQDFDRLLAEAHRRGLKVMIDQVLSHTSSDHEWFKESRRSRDNARANWYVWADPKPDGTPPNNWLSIFGGVAWRWEPRRQQYYLHNFLSSQPDLNFHEPAVREAIISSVRFWLDRGVDGLRLDAINYCYHDALLRDNPPKALQLRSGRGFRTDNPYAFQHHWYNNTQPENLLFLEELRALLNQSPDAVSLGEISSEDSLATMAEYVTPTRLHMGYCFELMTSDFSATHIKKALEELEGKLRGGWPCWAISNHDVERVVTRWGGSTPPAHFANLLTALVCSLRGSVCVYQGEELGLTEADVPFESLRDPYGLAFWPVFKGRDGCRTPMPWDDTQHGGFTRATPWLPMPASHRVASVAAQEAKSTSVLNHFRALMRWRKDQPALRWGSIHFLDAGDPVVAFVRTWNEHVIVAAFNLSDKAACIDARELKHCTVLEVPGLHSGVMKGREVHLPAYSALFARRDRL